MAIRAAQARSDAACAHARAARIVRVANCRVVHHFVVAFNWKVARLHELADGRTVLTLIEGERVNWFAIEVAVCAERFGKRDGRQVVALPLQWLAVFVAPRISPSATRPSQLQFVHLTPVGFATSAHAECAFLG